MTLLQLKHLTKTFSNRTILHSLDLEVSQGEFLCILGQSGSGKTTLLRLIAGFERVDRGEIILSGKVISSPKIHLPPEKRDIGIVFQDHALWPHMSVFENVAFPLRVQKHTESLIQKKVLKALSDVSMENFKDTMPHQLSGGEAQRIALARTLIQEPRLIVFDEPLASLDALLRYELQGVIKKLHHTRGLTSLYITHDPFEAMRLGQRIAILDKGFLQQCDTPEKMYKEPRTENVARLLGQGHTLTATVAAISDTHVIFTLNDTSFSLPKGPHTFEPGTRMSLFIRPEHVFLDNNPQGLECTVKECFFSHDNLYALILHTKDGQTLQTKSPVPFDVSATVFCTLKGGSFLQPSLNYS